MLAIRLRTPANVWTARQAHRAAAVHAALASVFADVVVLPGTETVFLASTAPLTRDVDVLVARLAHARRQVDQPGRDDEPGGVDQQPLLLDVGAFDRLGGLHDKS